MCLLCQSTLTRPALAVVNVLRTVGHHGGSEVKNDINTVQCLAQFFSCLKTSMYCHEPQGLIWFCLCMFVFLTLKAVGPIELKIFVCVLLKKQRLHLHCRS